MDVPAHAEVLPGALEAEGVTFGQAGVWFVHRFGDLTGTVRVTEDLTLYH